MEEKTAIEDEDDRRSAFPQPHVRDVRPLLGARELSKNTLEAGAIKVDLGTKYQGVCTRDVYRRIIMDIGCGMDRDELGRFFTTLGASAEPTGGIHKNLGVGATIATLPKTVRRVFGEVAACKVAHAQKLTTLITEHELNDDDHNELVLTVALKGSMAEETVITQCLQRLGRRKSVVQLMAIPVMSDSEGMAAGQPAWIRSPIPVILPQL